MANKNSFDQPPLYDNLIKKDTIKMSDLWTDWFGFFIMNLTSYLSQGGIFLPQLSTTERDDLVNPENGQMIYNVSLNTAQYYKAGVWTSF